jgi:hypothetical protein
MRVIALILLALAGSCVAYPASARPCFARADVAAGLLAEYDEVPRMRALTRRGRLVEMFVAPSGSWTLMMTQPDGMSCVMASGHGVEPIEVPEGDPA